VRSALWLEERLLLLRQPAVAMLAAIVREHLERRPRPHPTDVVELLIELERRASVDGSETGSDGSGSEGGGAMMPAEVSTKVAASMLNLKSDRQVRNLIAVGKLRRAPGRRAGVELDSVIDEVARRAAGSEQ
jgi:hypothetical protein